MGRMPFFLIAVVGMGLLYGGHTTDRASSGGLRPVITIETPCGAVGKVYVNFVPAKEYCILYYHAAGVGDPAMPIRKTPKGTDFRMPSPDLRIPDGIGQGWSCKKENKVLEFPMPRK